MNCYFATRKARQRGILLIECMIYLSVVMVVVGLAMALLYRALEANRGLDRNSQDIARALRAGEQWREDVRRAEGPIQHERINNMEQIRIPQAGGEVFYAWTEGVLWRAGLEHTNYVPLLSGVKACQIIKDQRLQVSAYRLEIELAQRQKAARLRPLFSFGAVPQPSKTNETQK